MKNSFRHATRLLTFALVTGLAVFLTGCGAEPQGGTEGAAAPPARAIPDPLTIFKAQISVLNVPATVKTGEAFEIELKIKNLGDMAWSALGGPQGENSVHICHHWLDANGNMLIFDGVRSEFPKDIAPLEEVTLKARARAPEKPGDYIMEIDLVQERVSWFKERGSKSVTANIKVE